MYYSLSRLFKNTLFTIISPERTFREIDSNPSFSLFDMFMILSVFGFFYDSLHNILFHFDGTRIFLWLWSIITDSILGFGISGLSVLIISAVIIFFVLKKLLKLNIKFNRVMLAVFYCSNILIIGPFIDLLHPFLGIPLYRYNNIELHIALPILFLIIWYQLFYFLKAVQIDNKNKKIQIVFFSLFFAILLGVFLKGTGSFYIPMFPIISNFISYICAEYLTNTCFIVLYYPLSLVPLVLISTTVASCLWILAKKY